MVINSRILLTINNLKIMMIITNGRVFVDPAMNVENMEMFIEDISNNMNDLFDEEISFEKIEEPFLMYKIPENIAWKNIMDARPPETDIRFMAIGHDDEVQLPYSQHRTIQHFYTVEELQEKADEMTRLLEEINGLEAKKKSIAKQLSEEISCLHGELLEIAKSHRRKFEDRDCSVFVIMNFKEGMKYYHSTTTGELVGSEKMTDKDQRTLFDIKGYDPSTFNEETINSFEIGSPDLDNEEIEREFEEMSEEINEISENLLGETKEEQMERIDRGLEKEMDELDKEIDNEAISMEEF